MDNNKSNEIIRIGISGKRNIKHNEKDIVRKCIETQIKAILKDHHTTEFVGYSSLAIGADTIFADVVVNIFKMPLHVVLPFPIEEYQKDFAAEEDILNLNYFLANNEEIVFVSDTVPTTTDERNQKYFDAGKFIVDKCDNVVFVWDKLKPEGKGGTAEIIGYYSDMKNRFPVNFVAVTPINEDLLHTEINMQYELSNSLALQSRDDYKLIWKLAIVLGWLAVGLFAANTAIHLTGIFNIIAVSIELILVIITFSLIIKAKKKDYHGKYLSHRLRAETLRIVKYYYHSNKEIKLSAFTLLNDKELSILVEKINQTISRTRYVSKWYTNYSIRSLIEDQKKYHENKISAIGSKFHLFELFNLTIAVLFMLNLLVHLTNALLEYNYPDKNLAIYSHELTVFFSIILPATYAAFEGVVYFQEWAVLKKYSQSAKQSLHQSINELPLNLANMNDNICSDKQSVALNLVSSIMLTDNRNWHLILENKNNYHWVI